MLRWSTVLIRIAVGLAVALLVLLIALPLLGLVLRIAPGDLLHQLRQPIVLDALRLSLITSVTATLLVIGLGLPVAGLIATREFPGKRALEVLIELPMVLPPTVAGLGLLLAFGRTGLAGRSLEAMGISLPFSTAAVVLAQAFVAAPFFITASVAGFREVERRYLDTAATLGAPPLTQLIRVILPLSLPSLLAGAAMGWARALGEFGATITFAGNLQGVTQTMPLAVYLALETDLRAAVALAVLLLIVSIVLLLAVRTVAPRHRLSSSAHAVRHTS